MAVASDAIYNVGTATTSYVSSSAYYGYVPPCMRENQHEHILECDRPSEEYSPHTERVCGSAMETDDDGYDYSAASRRLNNHCVIADTSSWFRSESGKHEECRQQMIVQDADRLLRRNRKRSNGDHGQAREFKKLRQEAVVTAAFTMVQGVQTTMDWPRCRISRHHYI